MARLSTLLFSCVIHAAFSASVITRPQALAAASEIALSARGDMRVMDRLRAHPTGKKPFRQAVKGSTPTGYIQVGTPSKYLYVIMDTGSDKLVAKTWETISAELDSIDQGVNGDVMPSNKIYNHNTSMSYHRKYIHDKYNHTKPEQSSITYGSGTAITDDGTEHVVCGNRKLDNFTIMEITADSLQLLHTKKGVAGVLGLQHMKNKSLGHSLFSRMRDADELTSFGYCRGSGNNGTFIWGDDCTDGQKLDVVGEMHWAFKVGNLKVQGGANKTDCNHSNATTVSLLASADEPEDIDEDAICKDNSCCGILDTGSNIIAGPKKEMEAIAKTANVKTDCSNFDSLPNITLQMGSHSMTIHPSGYVMKVPMPTGEDGFNVKNGQHDAAAVAQEDEGDDQASGLAEAQVLSRRAAVNAKWISVFERLHKTTGVDMRDMVRNLLESSNDTKAEFMCMPALVPLDKHTKYGPLYVIGTPLLDSHYARWSFPKGEANPSIHLAKLEDAKCACRSGLVAIDGDMAPPPANGTTKVLKRMLRQEDAPTTDEIPSAAPLEVRSGPYERLPEDIQFPHWARELLHV